MVCTYEMDPVFKRFYARLDDAFSVYQSDFVNKCDVFYSYLYKLGMALMKVECLVYSTKINSMSTLALLEIRLYMLYLDMVRGKINID